MCIVSTKRFLLRNNYKIKNFLSFDFALQFLVLILANRYKIHFESRTKYLNGSNVKKSEKTNEN